MIMAHQKLFLIILLIANNKRPAKSIYFGRKFLEDYYQKKGFIFFIFLNVSELEIENIKCNHSRQSNLTRR